MRIVIGGCGRVGRQVALLLSQAGEDVSVVDSRPEAAELLGKSFDGTFHTGLIYDVDALEEAGIRDADAFLAVTDSDNANLMAVQLAKEVFEVPLAIARLDDPAREQSYRALNVSFVAGAHLVAKVMVERIREPDFEYHVSFPTGDVQILEIVVGRGAAGVSVRALEREGGMRVAAIRRGDSVLIADEDLVVESGDIVVAAVRQGSEARLRVFLAEEDKP
jgi:trk system potassium uptake protein TrkA